MAKAERVYNSTDAAGIKPKLIPNYELMARDDSGGPDWNPRTAEFGDGGYVVGQEEKGHLSAKDGGQHERERTELSDKERTREYDKESGGYAADKETKSKVDDEEAED